MNDNPVTAQAEARFLTVARLLGEEHGAAGMTPYVHPGHPRNGSARTPAGYTRHIADGDGIVPFRIGLRIPQPDHALGGWSAGYDAQWRIAREYIRAYDWARRYGAGLPAVTPALMTQWMQCIGIADAQLRAGNCPCVHPVGTLPDGSLAVVIETGPGQRAGSYHPLTGAPQEAEEDDRSGVAMRLPLSVIIYPPSSTPGGPCEAATSLSPAAAVADLLHRSEVASVLASGADPGSLVAAAYVRMWADMILRAIDTDIAQCAVPGGLTSFFQLHDHVDACTYLEDAHVPFGPVLPRSEADTEGMRLVGAVTGKVSQLLAQRTAQRARHAAPQDGSDEG
jgi:hypothetical protein